MRKIKILMSVICLTLLIGHAAVLGYAAESEPEPESKVATEIEPDRYGGVYTDLREIYNEVQEEQREEPYEETEMQNELAIAEKCVSNPRTLNSKVEIEITEETEYNDDTTSEISGVYNIPNYSGMKSWMSWRSITSKSSPQYKLQQLAWTNGNGFRQVDGRYCVAIGMYFDCEIGDWVDLILENGTVIPAIVGDRKAMQHTDGSGLFTSANNCMSEMIIDLDSLDHKVKNMGDCSYLTESWHSRVVQVIIYDKNSLC